MLRPFTILFVILFCLSLSDADANTNAETLPLTAKYALTDAYDSGNEFVLNAVEEKLKTDFPHYSGAISAYRLSLSAKLSEEKQSLPKKTPKTQQAATSSFKGNIDAGLTVASGNTETQNFNVSSALNYKKDVFDNSLELKARSSAEDDVRTNEEYFVNNQSRYIFSPKMYSFFELEYVNDRFSGFQYRTSELLGYGYKFYDNTTFQLSGELGAGARQSLSTNEERTNSLLGKATVKTFWQLSEALSLENKTSSSYGSDALITISDTDLKSKLTDSLYFKLNYNLQHIDDVPADKKHLDSITSLGLGYEF